MMGVLLLYTSPPNQVNYKLFNWKNVTTDKVCLTGCENTLQVFVSRGLENTLDLDGRTPLMWATARGIISGISALKTSFLEAQDAQGYTALHIAGTRAKIFN